MAKSDKKNMGKDIPEELDLYYKCRICGIEYNVSKNKEEAIKHSKIPIKRLNIKVGLGLLLKTNKYDVDNYEEYYFPFEKKTYISHQKITSIFNNLHEEMFKNQTAYPNIPEELELSKEIDPKNFDLRIFNQFHTRNELLNRLNNINTEIGISIIEIKRYIDLGLFQTIPDKEFDELKKINLFFELYTNRLEVINQTFKEYKQYTAGYR